MEDFRVSCSVKLPDHPHAHERIQRIGGVRAGEAWVRTRDQAIREIDNHERRYYVQLPNGTQVNVIATKVSPRYLKTEGDGVEENNLLSLPDCPR